MPTQLTNMTLVPAAQQRLETYLSRLRSCLAACRSLDPADVERDVLDHIEQDLAGADQPVDEPALAAVLGRLGSPAQWVPVEDLPWWRRTLLRLRHGPEDWRLAYLSFGVFALGLLLAAVPPVLPLAVFASFILARAEISTAADPRELGPRRWLVYPPLLAAYIFVGAWALALPAVGAGALGWGVMTRWHCFGDIWWISMSSRDSWQVATAIGIVGCFAAAGATMWWLALRLLLPRWPALLEALVAPFGRYITRKWLTGLVILGAAACVLLLIATRLLWTRVM